MPGRRWKRVLACQLKSTAAPCRSRFMSLHIMIIGGTIKLQVLIWLTPQGPRDSAGRDAPGVSSVIAPV
jgi:hypothetical protein